MLKLYLKFLICLGDDIKPCPRCQVLIVKMDDGSCNHMTCAVCGAEFCWLCMKEISDLHYLRYYHILNKILIFTILNEIVNIIIYIRHEFYKYFTILLTVLLAVLFGVKSRGPERKRFFGNLELWWERQLESV